MENFAGEVGLNVVDRDPGNQTLVLSGRVDDFSKAFQVQLHEYRLAGGAFRGRTGFVWIPKQLEAVIIAVSGLDNRPMRQKPRAHASVDSQAARILSYTGKNLAQRYRFPAVSPSNGRPLDGKGQTVAIIEQGGGYLPQDIEDYFRYLGMPRPHCIV